MQYLLHQALEILERTPRVLADMLGGLSDDWTRNNEGGDSWSPYDVIGHLIHGERTDWIARMKMVIEHGTKRAFDPFDRFAQFEESKGRSLADLLQDFKELRMKNIVELQALYDESLLDKLGMHPSFGEVTMRNLLSTWVAHDLDHIAQIARVMAKQYESEVGPWKEYLPVLMRK